MKTTGYSRVSKDLIIGEIEKELKSGKNFFITQYGRVSASTMDKLRAKLRPSKSRYFVVKGSLGKKAFERAKLVEASKSLEGACGIAFTDGDPALSSKALVEFAKENEAFKIQSGFLNGRFLSPEEVKALASLPSREVLLAKVVGGMQAPISRLAGVLAGTLRQVVTVLDAIAKKKSS